MWHSESFDSSLTRQTFVLQRLWKKRSRKLLSQDVYFSQPMVSCRKRNLVLVTFPQSHYIFIQQLFHLKCSKPDIYLCISVMCLLSCAGGICLPRDRKIGKPQSSSSASPYRTEVIGDPRTFREDSFLCWTHQWYYFFRITLD